MHTFKKKKNFKNRRSKKTAYFFFFGVFLCDCSLKSSFFASMTFALIFRTQIFWLIGD